MNCSVQLREDRQERILEPHRRWSRRDSPTGNSIFMPEEPRLQSDDSQITTPIIRGGGSTHAIPHKLRKTRPTP